MISIIVPVYKSEKTLPGCVESLLAQTWEQTEIILIDDDSPDNCPSMCDAYGEKYEKIRVIHKENLGVSSARNAGIDAARGKYVMFVDSDDSVEPDMCMKLRTAMEEKAAAEGGKGMALCGYHHHYVGHDVEKIPGKDMDLLELYGSGYLNMPWNKLFLREGLGHFPEDLDLGEDLLFNLAYLRTCSWYAVADGALYHYIQNENGKTLSSQKRENKLELSGRIRREAAAFFGEKKDLEESRIRCVVDTRFLCESLDDIERLPFDREMSSGEKRGLIRKLSMDPDIREACKYAKPGPLDYRILQKTLGKGKVCMTYDLSVLRSILVRMKRAFTAK